MKYREAKLRGIPRRMRSLRRWSLGFRESFPSQAELAENNCYWNWKLPTHWAMVEGRQSTAQMKREIAQLLIEACGHLINAKPSWAGGYRVTCSICLPDMFSSEICIYLDEQYFQGKIEEGAFAVEGASSRVITSRIHDRSLASEWELAMPVGVSEIGIHVEFGGYAGGQDAFTGDCWFYGEIDGGREPRNVHFR